MPLIQLPTIEPSLWISQGAQVTEQGEGRLPSGRCGCGSGITRARRRTLRRRRARRGTRRLGRLVHLRSLRSGSGSRLCNLLRLLLRRRSSRWSWLRLRRGGALETWRSGWVMVSGTMTIGVAGSPRTTFNMSTCGSQTTVARRDPKLHGLKPDQRNTAHKDNTDN